MTYSVKELFYSLQGEGVHTGRPAVFCRFSGCNLWSGLEKHRNHALCNFCDTDFKGTDGQNGGTFANAGILADAIKRLWPFNNQRKVRPFVVCTGGEPLLQLDNSLVRELHNRGFFVAVETNGTIAPPENIDWLCLSPKNIKKLVIDCCDELKLVYPQTAVQPEQVEKIRADYYYLSPMAPPQLAGRSDYLDQKVIRQTIDYCLNHPQWRLNLQTHKIVGIC